MTHNYSRAQPTTGETDKIRRRLSGRTEPNASGAEGILPGSEDSLRRQLPKQELTDEQKATAEHNRKNREQVRLSTLEAQRAEAGQLPEDPVNGEDDSDLAIDVEKEAPATDELLD